MPRPAPYHTKSGAVTYRVRFRIGTRQLCETFDTKREADRFCASIYAHGSRVALNLLLAEAELKDSPTVAELAEQWLTWKESDPNIRSDRTVADYRRDYENWIRPTFGDLPAIAVDERRVQDWVDAMVAGRLNGKRLEPKSVADRHFILHSIYLWAMAPSRRLIQHDPCTATQLPKRRKKAPKGLRPAEWAALYPALQQIDPDGADLALFLLATGWRISEAAALSAYDVEDDGRTVHITMGRVVRRNAAGQHVIVEDAKSEAGLRRIELDPEAAAMIRRRMQKVIGDGLVLTTRAGGQWHYANFLNRAWKPAVKAANLGRRPTPHWLRHTSVAWLVMTGKVSLPEIQRRIGHESIDTTINVYGRMIDDVSPEALAAFAALRQQVSSSQPVPELDTGDERPPHTRA